MSTSPPATQSTKRPLEETSSPSRTSDQPDAKRPALDKVIRGEEDIKAEPKAEVPVPTENGHEEVALPAPVVAESSSNGETKTNGDKAEVKDEQGDTIVPDAAETKPITSTQGGAMPSTQATPSGGHDETAWIHIRAVITSPEAATIIGKGGENVSKIRQMSNAKCTVSDYQKGAIERILTVSGNVDAVAKVSYSCHMLCIYISFTNPARHSD